MSEGLQLLNSARSATAETEGRLRGHPFVTAVEQGRVDLAALHCFCGSQYQMWKSNTTAVSMARFENHPYRDVFLTPPEVEVGAARELAALAEKLGMDPGELKTYDPAAELFAYAAYKAWLICFGSAAEMACARALNLAAWGYNCEKMGRGLQAHYGLAPEEAHFFDTFSGLQELHSKAAKVIDDDLQNGVEPFMIVRAARLMQSYELMFWDEMGRQAGL